MRFTLGQVAEAIGIARPTLLSWAQRGRLPFLDKDREFGQAREFDKNEVIYTAALAALSRHMDAIEAARVLSSVAKTPSWRFAINHGFPSPVYVGVKRYLRRPEIDAKVFVNDEYARREFETSPESGGLIGLNEQTCWDNFSCAFFEVSRPISAALARIVDAL